MAAADYDLPTVASGLWDENSASDPTGIAWSRPAWSPLLCTRCLSLIGRVVFAPLSRD